MVHADNDIATRRQRRGKPSERLRGATRTVRQQDQWQLGRVCRNLCFRSSRSGLENRRSDGRYALWFGVGAAFRRIPYDFEERMHPSATPIIRFGWQKVAGSNSDFEWGAVEGLCFISARHGQHED